MNTAFKNKLASMLGKMDEKVLEARLNTALDMLKNQNPEELREKMKNIDTNDFMEKLNEAGGQAPGNSGMDKDTIRERLQNIDMDKVSQVLGESGEEMVKRIKDILK